MRTGEYSAQQLIPPEAGDQQGIVCTNIAKKLGHNAFVATFNNGACAEYGVCGRADEEFWSTPISHVLDTAIIGKVKHCPFSQIRNAHYVCDEDAGTEICCWEGCYISI